VPRTMGWRWVNQGPAPAQATNGGRNLRVVLGWHGWHNWHNANSPGGGRNLPGPFGAAGTAHYGAGYQTHAHRQPLGPRNPCVRQIDALAVLLGAPRQGDNHRWAGSTLVARHEAHQAGKYYSASAAAEGAATGLAVSGGQAVAAFGGVAGAGAAAAPGLGMIAGAIGVDVAALLTVCSRVIAHDALYYGYDPRDPAEEVFMMQVIALGLAVTPSAKAVAYQQLAVLTRSLAVNATWRQLNQQTLVGVVRKFATQFGQRLTKKKLGQFVPVAGVGIGAALNWKMVDDVANAAYWAYRERFLYDKGGDLEPIIVDADVDESADENDAESPIDVIGILESEGIVLDDEGDFDDHHGDETK
jgi:EcsC protein family